MTTTQDEQAESPWNREWASLVKIQPDGSVKLNYPPGRRPDKRDELIARRLLEQVGRGRQVMIPFYVPPPA